MFWQNFFRPRRSSGTVANINAGVSDNANTNDTVPTNCKNNKSEVEMTVLRELSSFSSGSENRTGYVANVPVEGELERALTSRHLNMLAFSGSVGTGLIIGSGPSLHNGKSIT
jgi:amino acid permease